MRVLVVLGTRPEAIKLSPVIMKMRKRPDDFEVYVCATGQHREMAQQALATFGIEPDYHLASLSLTLGKRDLAWTLGAFLNRLGDLMAENKWDLVLVQGDTTSALAGALSAFYHKIPVAHVEAGLRSYDKTQPWPEEVNRRLITQIADWHFAPTQRAAGAVMREANVVRLDHLHIVGNTVIDALLWVMKKHPQPLDVQGRCILVTAHRRENWGQGIANICEAIKRLRLNHDDLFFVWALHPNPMVTDAVRGQLGEQRRVWLRPPLDYLTLVRTMMAAHIILTDSGGIQEEAPTLNTPVLVLRDKTERPEVIECGAAKLVGTDPDRIVAEVTRLLTDEAEYRRMASAPNPYGDGHAAERIVEALLTTTEGGKHGDHHSDQ